MRLAFWPNLYCRLTSNTCGTSLPGVGEDSGSAAGGLAVSHVHGLKLRDVESALVTVDASCSEYSAAASVNPLVEVSQTGGRGSNRPNACVPGRFRNQFDRMLPQGPLAGGTIGARLGA